MRYESSCCEHAYLCPGSMEEECLFHGGFDNCCGHPKCPGNINAAHRRTVKLSRFDRQHIGVAVLRGAIEG